MNIQLNDLGYGVELKRGEESRFFQGDDASVILDQEDKVVKIWTRRFGKGYRKTFGPFKSCEEHITAAFDCYFE
jgi:hypothetical protein